MISNKLLHELKTIMKEEFNLSLSKQDIAHLGNSLAKLFQHLIDINTNYHEKT
jgi:hypothetical protein